MAPLVLALMVALLDTKARGDGVVPVRPCRSDPRVVGDCFPVRGRLHFANGNPALRMWIVGTKRLLGVRDDEDLIVPANLAKCLVPDSGDAFERTTFGDFVVCPFTADRPGRMRMVCIESAANLVIQDEVAGPDGRVAGPPRRCARTQ